MGDRTHLDGLSSSAGPGQSPAGHLELSHGWRPLPVYLVRVAGFAFARLEPLRCVDAARAANDLLTAERERALAGTRLDEALAGERYRDHPAMDDPAARKALSRHVKAARAFARGAGAGAAPGESLDTVASFFAARAPEVRALRSADDALRAARAAYEASFAAEFDAARAVLRELYQTDARLREAVFLESPAALERVDQLVAAGEGPRGVRARQRERLAIMYAQRFCAKNDTNSLCGPHGLAWLDDRTDGASTRLDVEAGEVRRETYVSHWAAERLLAEFARRAGASAVLPLRVRPTVTLEGNAASWCAMEHDATTRFVRRYARATLPPEASAIVELLQARPRPPAELAAEAPALGLDAAELESLIDQLERAGLVSSAAELPPGHFSPLRAVADEVRRWPAGADVERAGAELAELETLVDTFARSGLDGRVETLRQLGARYQEITGEAASRSGGQHYADRALLHEDCFVRVDAELGPGPRAQIEQALVPLLRAVELPIELARERVRGWFEARFGKGVRVPAIEAHRAFDNDDPASKGPLGDRAEALAAAIERVRRLIAEAAAATDEGVARIAPADLHRAVDPAPAGERPSYVSADLMLSSRPDGGADVVMGEMHGFFWLPTCLLDVAPEPERGRAVEAMRSALRLLAGGVPTAECRFAHTQATDRRVPLGDVDLELVVASDRPGALRFGQLTLELADGRLRYLDGDREVAPIVAYGTYPFLLYTSPLAPVIDDFSGRFFPEQLLPERLHGADAPRLAVGDLVFRRRTWARPASALLGAPGRGGHDADGEAWRFRWGQALRDELGCPTAVFASLASEPKPVLVDFDNYFLIEAFAHLLERQEPSSKVKLTEMLPGPGQLVARGPDGPRTSELRMGFYRPGAR